MTYKEEEEENIRRLLLGIMEGYRDSVIPPLPDLLPLPETAINENGSSSRKRGRTPASQTENIQKERHRRDKMTQKFSVLQSMVPNLFPKATREMVVSKTIDYIKRLEEERSRLENLKKSILPESKESKPTLSYCTNRSSTVKVNVSGGVAFFGIQLAIRRRMVPKILGVFEKYNAEILAANFSVNEQRQLTLTVTAVVGGNREDDAIENIKRDILIL